MEEIKIGDRCPHCGAKAELRKCSVCGKVCIEGKCYEGEGHVFCGEDCLYEFLEGNWQGDNE